MNPEDELSTEIDAALFLLSDEDIAKILKLTPAWVRKQRYLRRKECPHAFDIDPVLVGGMPRYRYMDVQNWVNGL